MLHYKLLRQYVVGVHAYNAHDSCICTVKYRSECIFCEYCRCTPYSHDLKWQIVWQRIALDLDICTIASNLNTSLVTIQRICTLFEQTGNVDPKVKEHAGFIVDESCITLYLLCLKTKITT